MISGDCTEFGIRKMDFLNVRVFFESQSYCKSNCSKILMDNVPSSHENVPDVAG